MPCFRVTSPGLFIRPQPSPDNNPLGELKLGAVVEKLGESGKWYFVKVAVDSDDFKGEITGWASSEFLVFATPQISPTTEAGAVVAQPPETSYPTEPVTIYSDLKKRPSPVTAALIDSYLEKGNSPLKGLGTPVMATYQKYGINPSYIISHAIHETGWGKSHICQEKHNLFGWGAIDSDPAGGAGNFASFEICIDMVMGRINELYLNDTGRFFMEKPCLGNKSYGMNVYYATDPEWGSKIARIAATMEDWVMDQLAQPQKPQPVAPPENYPPDALRILAVVDKVNPVQPYYLRHDIDGDGIPETFCNWFVADALEVMGIQLPRYDDTFYPTPHPLYGNERKCKPWTAGALYGYFAKGGDGNWKKAKRPDAVTLANQGKVVVVAMPPPPGRAHGHVALVIPGGSGSEVHIAQAGGCCGKNLKLEQGFGNAEVAFFGYKS
jgi:hypothetical protein